MEDNDVNFKVFLGIQNFISLYILLLLLDYVSVEQK